MGRSCSSVVAIAVLFHLDDLPFPWKGISKGCRVHIPSLCVLVETRIIAENRYESYLLYVPGYLYRWISNATRVR